MIPFLVFATVGAVISPSWANVIGWLCCAIGLGLSLSAAWAATQPATTLAAYLVAGRTAPGMARGLGFTLSLGLLFTFVLLLFPRGRLPSRRWRPVGRHDSRQRSPRLPEKCRLRARPHGTGPPAIRLRYDGDRGRRSGLSKASLVSSSRCWCRPAWPRWRRFRRGSGRRAPAAQVVRVRRGRVWARDAARWTTPTAPAAASSWGRPRSWRLSRVPNVVIGGVGGCGPDSTQPQHCLHTKPHSTDSVYEP